MAKSKKKGTLVCFLLDMTGSMTQYKKETIEGFNSYVEGLKEGVKGKKELKSTKMMLTKFNTQVMEISDMVPITEMEELTGQNYRPNHWTPLYDAIGKTIVGAEKAQDGQKVLFVIMTDGEENSSTEYNRDGIFKLIEDKQADGWEFMYLGANQDAYRVGGNMGVPRANTSTYTQSKTAETFHVATQVSTRYAVGESKDASIEDEERKLIDG
jgi:uncharacterized protein YegL